MRKLVVIVLVLLGTCAGAEELVVSRQSLMLPQASFSDSAPLKEGVYQVKPGTRVKVVSRKKDANNPHIEWLEVPLANGATGWLHSSVVSDGQAEPDPDIGAGSFTINNDGSPARMVSNPNFRSTGSDIALLPVGTEVTSLSTRKDPGLGFFEWHRVRVTRGDHKGKEGWVSVGVIRSAGRPPRNATHTLDNDGSATRVVPQPNYYQAANPGNDVAIVPQNTPVRVLASRTDSALSVLKWKQVEILAGTYAGKTGWVSANTVHGELQRDKSVEVRFRSFIPSPMVGFGGESVLNPFLGNLVFGGDDRTFGYGKAGYRSHQNVVVDLRTSESLDIARRWGLSSAYFARQAVHVSGRPLWWLGPKGKQIPVFAERLKVTDANNSVNVAKLPGGGTVVHLKLSGGNPAEPLTSIIGKIDANVRVYLRETDDDRIEFRYDMQHDGFPAYELYIDGIEVYTHDPVATSQHPLSLIGTGAGEFSFSSEWEVLE